MKKGQEVLFRERVDHSKNAGMAPAACGKCLFGSRGRKI